MNAEFADQIKKAHTHLDIARKMLELGYYDEAGRAAYLADFNAAQGYIFELTGQVCKTHSGLHDRFYYLAKDNELLDDTLIRFLARSYRLKAIADYEVGPSAIVPFETAKETIAVAERFVATLFDLIQRRV